MQIDSPQPSSKIELDRQNPNNLVIDRHHRHEIQTAIWPSNIELDRHHNNNLRIDRHHRQNSKCNLTVTNGINV